MRNCFLIFYLLCFSAVAQQRVPYKYLVLKGGGIRGIAYTGAIKVLEEQHVIDGLEKIGGTSIGAVVGAMVSVGMNAKDMERVMQQLDVASFNDGKGYFIGGSRRMRRNYGWYKGNKLERWLGDIIKQQTGRDSLT